MFFITCFSKSKTNNVATEMPNICDMRTFGYFKDYETCKRVLHENWGDIREAYYQYAVVEYIEQGLYPMAKEIEWFQWDKEKWNCQEKCSRKIP